MSKKTYNAAIQKNRVKQAELKEKAPALRTLSMYHGNIVPKYFIGKDGLNYVRMVPTHGIRKVNIHLECDLPSYVLYKNYDGIPTEGVNLLPQLASNYKEEVEAKVMTSDEVKEAPKSKIRHAFTKIIIRKQNVK